MQLIKEKLSIIKTNREIIQVLTLAPETSSIKKVANFLMLEYAACKARSLVQEKSQDTINLVKAFYDMKTMDFLDKSLEKKIMLVFPTIHTSKNGQFFQI